MSGTTGKRVSYDLGCLRSLKKLPDRVSAKFLEMMTRYMSDPSGNGLNLESIEGARDRGVKSIRIDQGYRAIAFDSGNDIMFLHVNEHDKAYRWAAGRSVRIDADTNRIRVVDEVETAVETASSDGEPPPLFSSITEERLLTLGLLREELVKARQLRNLAELEAAQENFDSTSFDILIALEAGYSDSEILELIGTPKSNVVEERVPPAASPSFSDVVSSDESRQRIFIPETEDELRRFFDGDLEGWRVFLHPNQRRIAYRDYNGPALVRGGAGTGKTVVAMHRAKYLADRIAADSARAGQRVLVTTFTTSLANDIEANLRTLCPEHLDRLTPRIEIINLDRWVSQFLKRKKFGRNIAYFGEERERLDRIWREVFDDRGLPEGLTEEFVRAEWSQVVQARGVMTERAYFKVSRAGRGTPLDRSKRAALWNIFSEYRARMIDAELAEPDDAYREAVEILGSEAPNQPYSAVVVDEAQDMGEQAFRLIRAIIPEWRGDDQNAIFIVGDAHQRIYGRKASLTACGINVRGRSRHLRLNYRTSEEIRNWAVSILEGVQVDDLDEGLDSLSGYKSVFRGPLPELADYAGEDEEIAGLVRWLRDLEQAGTQPADVGVLVATRTQLEKIEMRLGGAGIPTVRLKPSEADDRNIPGLRLSTMHRAKGLEFQAIAIPFLSNTSYPPPAALRAAVDDIDRRNILQQEKSLLYVAATRAKRSLRVSWSGDPSKLLMIRR